MIPTPEAEMDVGACTYRLGRADDVPGILRLWMNHTDWGPISLADWQDWYVNTPYGSAIAAVASTPEHHVAGHLMLIPRLVAIEDTVVRALRLSSIVWHPLLRGRNQESAEYPLVGLLQVATTQAQRLGYQMVYCLPHYRLLPAFRWQAQAGLWNWSDATYPCVARPMTPIGLQGLEGIEANLVSEVDPAFDVLWQEVRMERPRLYTVMRDAEGLQWRNGSHLGVAVRDTRRDALIGYTAIRKPDRLLVDMLARSENRLHVLAATINYLAEKHRESVPLLKAMQTPALAPALQALDFAPWDYRFAFIGCSLDPNLPATVLDPEAWYLTPGD